MGTLVIVDHDNTTIHKATWHVITAALAFKEPLTCLVAGFNCEKIAEQAAVIAGVESVILVDDSAYTHQLSENTSALIASIGEAFSTILAPSSSFGKNCLPAVAARLDCCQVSDVTAIIDRETFEHPIYAGNAIERVRVLDAKKILTIRATAFNPVIEKQAPVSIEKKSLVFEARSSFVSHKVSQSTRPDLSIALKIVSGGRGLQSAEKFKLIEELADLLGAGIGASRAAVDAGFVPNDYQIGQTGKVVAPDLYIAVGISGAIQHLAGMKDSKVIVAINKDADAPIFQIATYGLVGDLFELVPKLIACLKQ